MLALLGCSGGSDGGVPVIGNSDEYNQVLKDAEGLSKDPLERFANDEDLSEADKSNLIKAANMFEAIRAYEPEKFAPYLGLCMIYRALGNTEKAEQYIRQCILSLPASQAPEIRQTAAEAHYQLSRVLFDEKKYPEALAEASTADQTIGDNPNYLVAKAIALVQLKREKEAKVELAKALKLNPTNRRATGLAKLLR